MAQPSRELAMQVMLDAAAMHEPTSSPTAKPAADGTIGRDVDYTARNRAAWERMATLHAAAGRSAWHADELRWGLWDVAESELGLLDGFTAGEDVIELGCGTAAISASFARRGLRPVAVDFARAQVQNVETLQRDFNLRFPLVHADAEDVPFDDESFDLAVTEYGASLWCDPRRWLPEAKRLLRPEGRLIFVTSSPFLLACTPKDGGPVEDHLVRDHFTHYAVDFGDEAPIEFHPTHGEWIRALRETGFVVENLTEVQPDPGAQPRFDLVSNEWARRWPSEEIWVAHSAS